MLAKIHKRVADGVNVRASALHRRGYQAHSASPAVVTGRGPPPLCAGGLLRKLG